MEAGIFWSLLMIVSFLFQAADTILKVCDFANGILVFSVLALGKALLQVQPTILTFIPYVGSNFLGRC